MNPIQPDPDDSSEENINPDDSSEENINPDDSSKENITGVALKDVTARDIHIEDIQILYPPPPPPPFCEESSKASFLRTRRMLLKEVNDFWIEGVLRDAEATAPLLDLTLLTKPRAVENNWSDTVALPSPSRGESPIEAGVPMGQIFDEANEKLFILGEPGAGKSIWMIRLTQELIQRAHDDVHKPIPVILNLSSWSERQAPLKAWVMDEMQLKYSFPTEICQPWLENNQIMLLLDGLDEVRDDQLDKCILAINEFVDNHLPSIAVACRTQENIMQSQKLKLHSAVEIQPPTQEQIEQYARDAGLEEGAINILQQHEEFVRTPLGLNLSTNLLQRTPSADPTKFEQDIMTLYVDNVLRRKGDDGEFTTGQSYDWLAWLASCMGQHNFSQFWLEQLQPSWLKTSRHRLLYNFCVMLIFSFILIALSLISNSIANSLRINPDTSNGLEASIMICTLILASSWLVYLLTFWFSRTVSALLACVLFTIGLFALQDGFGTNSAGTLIAGPLFALPGVIAGVLLANRSEIQVKERTQWVWQRAMIGLAIGLIAGITIGAINYFVGGQDDLAHLTIYSAGAAYLIGITAMYTIGFQKHAPIDEGYRPNRGVFLSARHAIRTFVIIELTLVIGGLVLGAFYSQERIFDMLASLGLFLLVGTPFALIASLYVGGATVIQHLALRLILSRLYGLPLNIAKFLDFAAERTLLHKIGGGYMFIHSAMQEHFVQRDPQYLRQ